MTPPEPIEPSGPATGFHRFAASVINALDWTGRVIGVVCLTGLFLALLANVILRYFFGTGIVWAYEIHAVLLPWLVAGGLVAASAQGRNIAITLLPDSISPGARRHLYVVVQILIAATSIGVLWTSQPIIAASQFQRLTTLGITQVWGYSSIVFMFACMAVIGVLDAVSLALGKDVELDGPSAQSLS